MFIKKMQEKDFKFTRERNESTTEERKEVLDRHEKWLARAVSFGSYALFKGSSPKFQIPLHSVGYILIHPNFDVDIMGIGWRTVMVFLSFWTGRKIKVELIEKAEEYKSKGKTPPWYLIDL